MQAASLLRRAAAKAARPALDVAALAATRRWPPHSRLFIVRERADWAIAEVASSVAWQSVQAGARLGPQPLARYVRSQSVFHASQFTLLATPWAPRGNNLAVSYFHGRPGTAHEPLFDVCYDTLRRRHEQIARVQVSHRAMRELVLETGIAAGKVFLIPIGIDTELFRRADMAARREARARLALPDGAFVVGSFLKDGIGWGEGLEPKLIKGPDVLLGALEAGHRRIPELHVLLTGPARGYVKQGLERLGIPYRHVVLPALSELPSVYPALDAMLVASRDEGGPKAVLESMASGVPIVSTRVGQAADLINDGENGFLADVGDPEALAEALVRVREGGAVLGELLDRALATAEEHTYAAQVPLWRRLLTGFVALDSNG